ncbi:aldehyde dehydrogenase family protein [Salinibacterium sp. ZJ454]|uniref:aldehyde dehydrogenase family protein n=1 Tax=Salinibacterium sp. ZJ454 TaxID=2708339 RepID=UPI001423A8EA|nr:aldehyde dehydrogenase family protein [Salinibacterium sp. ZJ454]
MLRFDKQYIGGSWSEPVNDSIAVTDAGTGQVMGYVPDGTPDDIDRAVGAAKAALPGWSGLRPTERAAYLRAIAQGLEARLNDVAVVMSREGGMPLEVSKIAQVGLPIMIFNLAADIAEQYDFVQDVEDGMKVAKEPVGVVGCITAWNYPLHQIAAKSAYAMAAGCTVVVKPSEVAPLGPFYLAEVVDRVGLPAGVFNLVSGTGPIVGEALVRHPDVRMVTFTGSTAAGKRVAALAAETAKRVTLELGGKSANVLLDDLDDDIFDEAVRTGIDNAFLHSGQTCSALTRMLVPQERLKRAEDVARAKVESLKVGGPLEPGVTHGPLANDAQVARVKRYITGGLDEGAKIVIGGAQAPENTSGGYFVQPTVFSEVTADMVIAQEEIFGPVLSLMPYRSEEEAVEIANGTPYGLAAKVWSSDRGRAERVGGRLRAGQVEINGGQFRPTAPFGGYGQSGYGRENGVYGLEEFLETKALLY